MKKKIAILGSTGSIGRNALDVISRLEGNFEVAALSAGSNFKLLSRQACKFRPHYVCIANKAHCKDLKKLVGVKTKVLSGNDGLEEIVSDKSIDTILVAISGTAAILPLLAAVKAGKKIALANKESIISAGSLVTDLAKKSGATIIPVDSEHSAIFQCLGNSQARSKKIYLTASGGPLLNVDIKRFDSLPRSLILNHPKWSMGEKITVDSATMMNKGLEIIEAQFLFGIEEKDIEVLIHREAIIHSMVEFADGSVLAQMGEPDMKLPIQYALTFPARLDSGLKTVDFLKVGNLSFSKPDTRKFPCLDLARHAARQACTYPAVLCSADEEAVRYFLEGKIKFSKIPQVIEKVLSRHKCSEKNKLSLNDILTAGEWAREEARSLCCH